MEKDIIQLYAQILNDLRNTNYMSISYDTAFDAFGSYFFGDHVEFDKCLKHLASQGDIHINKDGIPTIIDIIY